METKEEVEVEVEVIKEMSEDDIAELFRDEREYFREKWFSKTYIPVEGGMMKVHLESEDEENLYSLN